ncbi:DUF4359 domain-containing protein [Pantanalinema rosaneae CENA516]|uniref:DUF4359 domain-containing protein n=1 Tax=Pantanalinema rosaneae TaxID=1620701 RepID=UPI003D6ED82A
MKPSSDPQTADSKASIAKIGAISLAVLALVMAVTNPDQKAYVKYMFDHRLPGLQKQVCAESPGNRREQPAEIRELIQVMCQGGFLLSQTIGRGLLEGFIDSTTKRQNFGLFSLYTTETPVGRLKTIAIFNQFLTFEARQ